MNTNNTLTIPSLPQEIKDVDTYEIKRQLANTIVHMNEIAKAEQEKNLNQLPIACNINNVSWLENAIYKMENLVCRDIENDSDTPKTETEAHIELYKTLLQENKFYDDLIIKAKQELEKNEQILKQKKEYIGYCKSNIRANINDADHSITLNLSSIETNAKRRFRECRTDLNNIVDTCFDETMRELLQTLTHKYFTDDDKYVEITDELFPYIALLKKACLVTTHPYDKKKFKIDDIFD